MATRESSDRRAAAEADGALLERIRAGCEAALGELYDRHAAGLLAFARRIVQQAEEAEEVLQDVWVQVWHQAHRFAHERGSVEAWLFTITRSRALDRYRRVHRRRDVEFATSAAPDVPDETRTAEPDAGEEVGGLLAGLPPEQREVLEWAYFEGLTQSEIAARLGRPLGTIKTWMRRALLVLREETRQRNNR